MERLNRRRDKILEGALDVFAGNGFFATNIKMIASKLTLGHGTIYRYFDSKSDIFQTLVGRILESIVTQLSAEPPTAQTLDEYQEQLSRIGRKLYQIFTADPRLGKIFFSDLKSIDQGSFALWESAMKQLNTLTASYLKKGQSQGYIRSEVDTLLAGEALNSLLFSAIKAVLRSDAKDRDEVYLNWEKLIIEFITLGLAKKNG